MEVMIFLDFHHEGLSIGNLGNAHVPLMQFIHSRWEVLDLLGLDQRLASDIFPFYFLLSKRRHGLDIEELSNSDLEHFSLHYMIFGYYHIAQLGNVNGLPTMILGARTLMCCWHNKRGGRLRRLFSQLGNGFPAFLTAACWLELELASFCSRARCAFLIWRS